MLATFELSGIVDAAGLREDRRQLSVRVAQRDLRPDVAELTAGHRLGQLGEAADDILHQLRLRLIT